MVVNASTNVPNHRRSKRSTIIWEAAMTEAGAVRWAARGRRAYPEGVAYERITIDPDRMSGLPCIRDTRVTVSAVLGQLAAGLTIPELLADFPYQGSGDFRRQVGVDEETHVGYAEWASGSSRS